MFVICILPSRDYIHSVLRWVESQSNVTVLVIFIGLYTLVSLPIAWGYVVINIASGYLCGLKFGLLVTVMAATIGIFVANLIMKTFLVHHIERYYEK